MQPDSWRGGAARIARQAHNLQVGGSNPSPATNSELGGPTVSMSASSGLALAALVITVVAIAFLFAFTGVRPS